MKAYVGVGAILAIVGVLGIVLAAPLGFIALERPWSFFLGLVFGLATAGGIGFLLMAAKGSGSR